jgi:hypothetical protein
MNYEWKQISEKGQYEIGFIDIYELVNTQRPLLLFITCHSTVIKNKELYLPSFLKGLKVTGQKALSVIFLKT